MDDAAVECHARIARSHVSKLARSKTAPAGAFFTSAAVPGSAASAALGTRGREIWKANPRYLLAPPRCRLHPAFASTSSASQTASRPRRLCNATPVCRATLSLVTATGWDCFVVEQVHRVIISPSLKNRQHDRQALSVFFEYLFLYQIWVRPCSSINARTAPLPARPLPPPALPSAPAHPSSCGRMACAARPSISTARPAPQLACACARHTR